MAPSPFSAKLLARRRPDCSVKAICIGPSGDGFDRLRMAFDGSHALLTVVGSSEADALGARHMFAITQIFDRIIKITESAHG